MSANLWSGYDRHVVGTSGIMCRAKVIFIYKLYFAKMAAQYKKILNTKYTKKYKLYTDNKKSNASH